jgi:GTPase involved in cell partitioning and DNA repair
MCRHVDRSRGLAFVLDLSGAGPSVGHAGSMMAAPAEEAPASAAAQQLEVLVREIAAYDAEMLKRPCVVVLNKADSVPDPARSLAHFLRHRALQRAAGVLPQDAPVLLTSALLGHGVAQLQQALDQMHAPPE